ncbi:MAG: fatty acid CoA ligase family protein [Pseudomonadales bacterium]
MSKRAPLNIAAFITEVAQLRPHEPAIIYPSGRGDIAGRAYSQISFAELETDTNNIASGLLHTGLVRGDSCALMVKPSLDFFALIFALFKAGIVPVLIDPGIGLKPLKQCLERVEPRGFIGIGLAHVARILAGWARSSIEINITVGRQLFWGGTSLEALRRHGQDSAAFVAIEPEQDETAAILFTSGSTGLPKGVVYTHEIFVEQVNMIRDMFHIEPGEVDLPTFPLFSLFDPALGMTAVIPDMDARYPAKVDPNMVYALIKEFKVSNMFGSPGLLNTLSRDASERGMKAPGLKRVISAGAPTLPDTLQRMKEWLNDGVEVFTPYGATECMPICIIGSSEVLASRRLTEAGKGICVGKPFQGVDIEIIAVSNEVIKKLAQASQLTTGEIGEIAVHGPTVTAEYFANEEATRLAKMHDDQGRLYHRMGDVGYLDEDGRLWYCGRIAHIVDTDDQRIYTEPCEGIFNAHKDVFRSALVGIGPPGSARPVICVELEGKTSSGNWSAIQDELSLLAKAHKQSAQIEDFLLHPSFPVDIRHNAKIDRVKLGHWAGNKIR